MADSKIKCTPTQHQTLSSFITFKAWIEVTTVVCLFVLEYSCFVMCWFLLYNNVKQLYVHMYPLPLGLPSHPPSYPSRSSRSTWLSSLYQAAASPWLSMLYMAVQIRRSQFIPPSPTVSTHLFSIPVSLVLLSK